MIVRLKRSYDGSLKPTLPGDFVGIECEVVNPPSARGRTVWVYLDDRDVTDLLLELRAEATLARGPDHQRREWPQEPGNSLL